VAQDRLRLLRVELGPGRGASVAGADRASKRGGDAAKVKDINRKSK
jgi:hypothetical protein